MGTVCVSCVFLCTPACPLQMALSYLSLRCPRIFWLKDPFVFCLDGSWVYNLSHPGPKKGEKQNRKRKITQELSVTQWHGGWQYFGFVPFMQTQAHLRYDSPWLFITVPIMLLLFWWHHHRATGGKAGASPADVNANMTVSAADFRSGQLN